MKKIVKENIYEFRTSGEIIKMGISEQIKKDMSITFGSQVKYDIIPKWYIIEIKDWIDYEDRKKLKIIQDKYLNPVLLVIQKKLKIGSFNEIKKAFDIIEKNNIPEEIIDKLINKSVYKYDYQESDKERIQKQFEILKKKQERTPEKIEEDENYDTYIFIGYEDKKEIKIGDEIYYKKKLGIEKLVKIDRFNISDLRIVEPMKMRAKIQYGSDGNVYIIKLPKGFLDDNDIKSGNIPDYLLDLIDKHKVRI